MYFYPFYQSVFWLELNPFIFKVITDKKAVIMPFMPFVLYMPYSFPPILHYWFYLSSADIFLVKCSNSFFISFCVYLRATFLVIMGVIFNILKLTTLKIYINLISVTYKNYSFTAQSQPLSAFTLIYWTLNILVSQIM